MKRYREKWYCVRLSQHFETGWNETEKITSLLGLKDLPEINGINSQEYIHCGTSFETHQDSRHQKHAQIIQTKHLLSYLLLLTGWKSKQRF